MQYVLVDRSNIMSDETVAKFVKEANELFDQIEIKDEDIVDISLESAKDE